VGTILLYLGVCNDEIEKRWTRLMWLTNCLNDNLIYVKKWMHTTNENKYELGYAVSWVNKKRHL